MQYTIKPTAKGYIISVKEKKKKYVYFLRDDKHTKERYIGFILKHYDFWLGEPFGDNIYPIHVDYKVFNKIDDDIRPINLAVNQYKRSVVFSYYRSFITETTPKKIIKQYADEFKTNLSQMGLDALYEYVKTQA